MPHAAEPGPTPAAEWLSLQQASRRLDVHPATLREWADRGRIRTFRTPGGHRRFNTVDVDALARSAHPDLALLMSATVGQARIATTSGDLAAESWYRRFDDRAKGRQRDLGQDLVRQLTAYLGDPEANWSSEIKRLGERYARLAAEAGLTVSDAMRAFHLFEGMVRSSAGQLVAAKAAGSEGLQDRAAWFLNEVRVAMVESLIEEAK